MKVHYYVIAGTPGTDVEVRVFVDKSERQAALYNRCNEMLTIRKLVGATPADFNGDPIEECSRAFNITIGEDTL